MEQVPLPPSLAAPASTFPKLKMPAFPIFLLKGASVFSYLKSSPNIAFVFHPLMPNSRIIQLWVGGCRIIQLWFTRWWTARQISQAMNYSRCCLGLLGVPSIYSMLARAWDFEDKSNNYFQNSWNKQKFSEKNFSTFFSENFCCFNCYLTWFLPNQKLGLHGATLGQFFQARIGVTVEWR